MAELCQIIVAGGGTVLISDKDNLLDSPFGYELGLKERPAATLGYGQVIGQAGFHIMACPRRHWSETLTGLGACGIEVMLGLVEGYALAGHPLVPVLQVAIGKGMADDLDAVLADDAEMAAALLGLIVATLRGEYTAAHQRTGTHDFQVTRGLMGVSF